MVAPWQYCVYSERLISCLSQASLLYSVCPRFIPHHLSLFLLLPRSQIHSLCLGARGGRIMPTISRSSSSSNHNNQGLGSRRIRLGLVCHCDSSSDASLSLNASLMNDNFVYSVWECRTSESPCSTSAIYVRCVG